MKYEVWHKVALVIVSALCISNTSGQLQVGYYAQTCSMAEAITSATLTASFVTDVTSSASVLRLAFHDCIVGAGCDASIMLDSNGAITSELVADKNFGIRRLDFIDRVKTALEIMCPNTVSCADIIAMAGRDAVEFAGGPAIPILLGRKDATFASNRNADAQLPPATVSVDNFLNDFASFGMSVEESVAILGSHTLGVGHCVNVQNRLYPATEPQLEGTLFGGQLHAFCPTQPPLTNATIIPNDLTNVVFDNQYYRDLMNGRGLFTIDAEIAKDPRTSGFVANFAGDQEAFYTAFSGAYIKLTSARVLTQGQVRTNCHQVNP